MTTPQGITVLVDRLVADARPVRRLWAPRWRACVWGLVALALLGGVAVWGARPDFVGRLLAPTYAFELAAWLCTALAFGTAAMRTAVPGIPMGRSVVLAGGALGAGVATMATTMSADAGVTMAALVVAMRRCGADTVLLGLLPWVAVVIAQRRGAPLDHWRAAVFGASAAWFAALAAMRVRCPAEEILHVMIAHGLPALAAAGVATVVGVVVMRRANERR